MSGSGVGLIWDFVVVEDSIVLGVVVCWQLQMRDLHCSSVFGVLRKRRKWNCGKYVSRLEAVHGTTRRDDKKLGEGGGGGKLEHKDEE